MDPLNPQNGDSSSENITELLARVTKGDKDALDELAPLVNDELHRLAVAYLRRERREHTLQPTALVNELYLKLFGQQRINWRNRAQFFGIAAGEMRRILIDHARHINAKRRGNRLCVSLDKIAENFGAQPDTDLLALHEALEGLKAIDPFQARIVELRFFGGLTIEETAEVLDTSHATVEREWRSARAYLYLQLTRRSNSF
jgi:RNA polymerase sigma factor (TIGR02999 family)